MLVRGVIFLTNQKEVERIIAKPDLLWKILGWWIWAKSVEKKKAEKFIRWFISPIWVVAGIFLILIASCIFFPNIGFCSFIWPS